MKTFRSLNYRLTLILFLFYVIIIIYVLEFDFIFKSIFQSVWALPQYFFLYNIFMFIFSLLHF